MMRFMVVKNHKLIFLTCTRTSGFGFDIGFIWKSKFGYYGVVCNKIGQ